MKVCDPEVRLRIENRDEAGRQSGVPGPSLNCRHDKHFREKLSKFAGTIFLAEMRFAVKTQLGKAEESASPHFNRSKWYIISF